MSYLAGSLIILASAAIGFLAGRWPASRIVIPQGELPRQARRIGDVEPCEFSRDWPEDVIVVRGMEGR